MSNRPGHFRGNRTSRIVISLVTIGAISCTTCFADGAVTVEKIAATGDVISGASVGTLSQPVLNNAGQVAFVLGYGEGVATNVSGANTQVITYNAAFPGSPYAIKFVDSIILADNGNLAAKVRTDKSGGTLGKAHGYVIAKANGPLTKVMLEGDPAPASIGSGVTVQYIGGEMAFSNSGVIGFRTTLSGTGITTSNKDALWTATSGATLSLLARTGASTPGMPGRVYINRSNFPLHPMLGSAGIGAFLADTTDGGPYYGPLGVWKGSDYPSLSLVAKEGTATSYLRGPLSENDIGHVALSAATVYEGSLQESIWSDRSGTLQLIAVEGSSAPGLPGLTYGKDFWPILNNADEMAFCVGLSGSQVTEANDTAIFAETDSGFILVAREGDQVPGQSPGVTFSAVKYPSFNARGQLLFYGQMTDGHSGIFLHDPFGGLMTIAVEGTPLELASGIYGTPTSLDYAGVLYGPANSGGGDGAARALNDAGQVAFHARFSDGTDAILLATVPEPASVAMLAFMALALLRRRVGEKGAGMLCRKP